MGQSISASQGRVAQIHDEREYTPDNADERLKKNNVTIIGSSMSYEQQFNNFFQPVVDEYNEKQKRSDRKIDNYYESLNNSNRKEKPVYEYVFQIGNQNTNGITDSTFDKQAWESDKSGYDIESHLNVSEENIKCRMALDNAMSKLDEKYPNFKFWFVGSHGDEPNGTYHYHVAFTPVGTDYQNGMNTRCSLTKALNAMGFKTQGEDLAIKQWQNDVKDLIADEMQQLGIEREYMNNTDKHLSVPQFKLQSENAELQNSIEKKHKRIERQVSAFTNNKAVINKQAEKYKALKEQNKELETSFNTLTCEVSEQNNALTSLKAQIEVLQEQTKDYEADMKKLQEEQNKVESERSQFDEHIKLEQGKLAERDNALCEREQQVTEREYSLSSRESNLDERELALQSHENFRSAIDKYKQSIDSDLKQLKLDAQKKDSEIEMYKAREWTINNVLASKKTILQNGREFTWHDLLYNRYLPDYAKTQAGTKLFDTAFPDGDFTAAAVYDTEKFSNKVDRVAKTLEKFDDLIQQDAELQRPRRRSLSR